MEHKTMQFEVVQATNPYCWKWIVFLDATRMRTGIALTRADAVLDAELAIEKRWSSSGPAEASPIARGGGQPLKIPLASLPGPEHKLRLVRSLPYLERNGHGIQRARILRRGRNNLRDPGHWLRRWSYVG